MEAENLKQIDKDYRNHLQAFLNFAVQGKKKAGKNKERPVYRTFKAFYDYEEILSRYKNNDKKSSRFDMLSKHLKERG